MSVSEKWFWRAVRKDMLGFRVRRQHRVGPYFLDFYVPSAKVCIEIDGEQHEGRREADRARDAYLSQFGVLTIRIPSLDLFYERQDLYTKWIYEVQRVCESRTLHPPAPSSRKRKEGE
jgi:very-short-patch-repair endonuclease